MTRTLAHHIVLDGTTYHMSIAEISDDGLRCTITPYVRETSGTRFVSGTLHIRRLPTGKYCEITNHESQITNHDKKFG